VPLADDPEACYADQSNACLLAKGEPTRVAKLSPNDHYNHDPVGTAAGIPGAGLLAFVTRDQLHPPMVDDEAVWSDGSRWYEGAVKHTIEALQLCDLQAGQTVLDIGCGVGGPARTVADTFGVSVTGINISQLQIDTARSISGRESRWRDTTTFLLHDCTIPLPADVRFDCIYSINMLYHIVDKPALFRVLRDSLADGGVLLIDDWMLTSAPTEAERKTLGNYFISPHFAIDTEIPIDAAAAGLEVTKSQDLSGVARQHMSRHFQTQFLKCFAPDLRMLDHGEQMVRQFLEAVEYTIELYASGRLTYRRFVATRIPEPSQAG